MSVFRPKHTIAVFETSSKTNTQFVSHALANGHHVVALSNTNTDFVAHKHFSIATADSLFENTDVVVINGAENHAEGFKAVSKVIQAVNSEKAKTIKHIYLISASGAKSGSGLWGSAFFKDLQLAEKHLAELVAKNTAVKYTVFRPPTLIDTVKSNDVFVFDEAAEKTLTGLSNQVSHQGLADAVLEIVETQPKFVNKTAGINSKSYLVEKSESRKAVYETVVKASPVFVVSLLVLGLVIVAKNRA
ncbi:hypothetical protein HDU98_007740 [Podochytrium sp. JEL0797]|nr:hypothetical protein HDU98_007740 [Podochytrium sp. JEL0797]